jgi:predicted RNA-binding Zn-ribbon protein involved in translation (DUF1610 family)
MEGQHEFIHKGRLNGSQRNKVKGLLNMLYTPRELSEELGINLEQVYRVYVPAGCPKIKDSQGRISINGKEFKAWFDENYQKKKLSKNQAYCVSCKKVVEIINPERKREGNIIYDIFNCPNCGKKVTRFIDCKRKKNDQQKELETD